MKGWQFNVLFFVGVGGAVFLMLAPAIGLDNYITKNPGNITGVGTILAYVLTQRIRKDREEDKDKKDDDDESEPKKKDT